VIQKLPLAKENEWFTVRDEEELADSERKLAWDYLHPALHWGAANARPIQMDQRMLIMIVAELLRNRPTDPAPYSHKPEAS
jgi:hypothetical protein